jgi:hypothetical protein
MKKFLFSIILTVAALNVAAQDPLAERFLLYGKAKNTTNLFVHFDKNVYSNSETVWFTGYLVSSSNINKHKLMSVALINNTDNKVIMEDRFIMLNGFSYGSMILPDTIQPGQYRLQAVTDFQINDKPEVTFTQNISIRSILEPAFKASMKILENNAKGTKVLVVATTADNRFLPKPLDVTYKYGKNRNVLKTDNSGQAVISLPAGLSLADPTIYVKLSNEKDSTSLNMPIPQPKGAPSVKFYPEGGNLVTGIINNVGLEVKNHQNLNIATKAYLLKNNIIADSAISTNTHGLGSFKFFVEDGAKYTLKVKGANLKDTLFSLPNSIENGLVLNLPKAIAKDTLTINIRAKAAQEVGLRIHNFRTGYLYTKLNVQPGFRTFKIPLTELPKGLASVTITDSEERPLAERIFFAHYDNSQKINIATDKTSYGPREKVNLKLKLASGGNEGLVSVAVVQDARLEAGKMTDIESYTFLSNILADFPNNEKGSIIKNQNYLEQLLLVKGWSRYTWNDFSNTKPSDTVQKLSNLQITGRLTKSNRPIKKSVSISAMANNRLRLISTNNEGVFDYNVRELYADAGKKLFLFLNKGEDPSLKFSVDNQLLATANRLALNPNAIQRETLAPLENNADLFVKSNEKSIRLQEVTISGRNTSDRGTRGRNACGDFVCPFNVFNCTNHYGDPNITQPIPGKVYKINGVSQPYPGCNVIGDNIFFKTEGVHLHKEFYVDDYKDPQEPAYSTTIFWNYGLRINKDKEVSVDFYTTDITGKFRVVVQGLTDKQVVHDEKFFEVKRK